MGLHRRSSSERQRDKGVMDAKDRVQCLLERQNLIDDMDALNSMAQMETKPERKEFKMIDLKETPTQRDQK